GEERLKAIFKANPDPFVVYDVNGHPLYLNPAFTEVFGWDLNEVQGRRIPFVPKDQEKISTEKIKEIYKTGNTVQFETKRLSKQGNTIDILLSAAIIKDVHGINNGLVVNLKNVTEQKNIEIQLRQSQKMEAIGTLAGGIAHDFNNILSGIFGYAQLTELDPDDGDKVRKNTKQVIKCAQRAGDLVQQILTFSRQAEHKTYPLKLFLIVKEAIKFLRSSIPATISIQDKISSKATVLADPTQAHQVVMNLCTNAYHAMRDSGGTLSIELDDIEITQQENFTTDSYKPGKYIKLEVRDTGQGMDKKTLERIFEPYFTTKQLEKGTGLGLAVVDGIIKKHNGFIRTYSEVGLGSTFQVFWPVIEKDDSSGIPEEKNRDLLKGTEQIMLVDDEINICDTSRVLLEKQGYKVIIFQDGLSALQAFTEDPDFFDLVVTDMAMPQMAGDELSTQILKLRKDMPIILCTGFSETMSEEKAASLGIKGFLLKPIAMNDLSHKVREVLDKK
ncbi:MAG: response regulator, partial [Desulfobacteraceae bacterium]|nr:response regulator [Desulfobacteraceae bacterium]